MGTKLVMTTQLKDIVEESTTSIMQRLRRNNERYGIISLEAERLLTRMYIDTYIWVKRTILEKNSEKQSKSIKTIANTLRRQYKSIESWFYIGKFMYENNIPLSSDPASTSAAYKANLRISKADRFTLLNKLKSGSPRTDIINFITKARMRSGDISQTKARNYAKKGLLNKLFLKMEMLALQTMAKKVFKKEVDCIIISKEGSEILLHTKGR